MAQELHVVLVEVINAVPRFTVGFYIQRVKR